MRYKIPKKALEKFIKVAKSNKSNDDGRHIETLAYLLGYEDQNGEIIATEMVFPNQNGTSILVIDEGKCYLKTLSLILYAQYELPKKNYITILCVPSSLGLRFS